MRSSERDAPTKVCGVTPQPRSEEAIELVLKQAAVFAMLHRAKEALADEWTGERGLMNDEC